MDWYLSLSELIAKLLHLQGDQWVLYSIDPVLSLSQKRNLEVIATYVTTVTSTVRVYFLKKRSGGLLTPLEGHLSWFSSGINTLLVPTPAYMTQMRTGRVARWKSFPNLGTFCKNLHQIWQKHVGENVLWCDDTQVEFFGHTVVSKSMIGTKTTLCIAQNTPYIPQWSMVALCFSAAFLQLEPGL